MHVQVSTTLLHGIRLQFVTFLFLFLLQSPQNVDPTLNICNLSQALVEVTNYYGLGIKIGLPPQKLKKIEADFSITISCSKACIGEA